MIYPCFTSHYSLDSSGVLSLEEPGKATDGASPSVFDLIKEDERVKDVILVEDRIDGLEEAYKTSTKLKVGLCYGIKFTVAADLADKADQSRKTESKIIIFVKNSAGKSDLIKIWNRAWTTGHYACRYGSYGRIDWSSLKQLWTPNLMLALPFFSSFLARNLLSMNNIVPDLPNLSGTPLWVMREIDSRLPFAPLISSAIDRYMSHAGDFAEVIPVKSIYYAKHEDFKSYLIKRCVMMRTAFDAPDVNHLSSDRFSWEAWKELSPL